MYIEMTPANQEINLQETRIAHPLVQKLDEMLKRTIEKKNAVKNVKEKMSDVEIIEINGKNFVEAHRKLGEANAESLRGVLNKKLGDIKREELIQQIRFVRKCRESMQGKTKEDIIPSKIRSALEEYFECLDAWADGAKLNEYTHSMLEGLEVDGKPVSQQDIALWLQSDTIGCQTGMIRNKDGSVTFWHSEEWPTEQVKRSQIIKFTIGEGNNKKEVNAFNYPYQLPGSAFSWTDGLIQGSDFIYLKNSDKSGSMSNVATWMILRLGREANPEDVVKNLTPFFDGYAISIVHADKGKVTGERIEFAGSDIVNSRLPDKTDSMLFQVNMFQQDSPLAERYSEMDSDVAEELAKRVKRTERGLHLINQLTRGGITPDKILGMMRFTVGNERWGYANPDVKAHAVAVINPDEMKISIGAGPAAKGEKTYTTTSKNT